MPRDSHPKSSPLLVPGGSLLPIGRAEVRTDPRKYRHKLRSGETRPRSPNFSPASHHRGGYSTAWTVADRRMHLQDPLGHKRLQTFPCEESRGRTSEGAGRAQVGPGTRARFRGAVRVKARFPPTTTMNTRLRPTSEPSARSRGSPYPRGRRGDLQSSETQDPVSAPPLTEGGLLPSPCATPPALHALQAGPPEPGDGRRRVGPGAGERRGPDPGLHLTSWSREPQSRRA